MKPAFSSILNLLAVALIFYGLSNPVEGVNNLTSILAVFWSFGMFFGISIWDQKTGIARKNYIKNYAHPAYVFGRFGNLTAIIVLFVMLAWYGHFWKSLICLLACGIQINGWVRYRKDFRK